MPKGTGIEAQEGFHPLPILDRREDDGEKGKGGEGKGKGWEEEKGRGCFRPTQQQLLDSLINEYDDDDDDDDDADADDDDDDDARGLRYWILCCCAWRP